MGDALARLIRVGLNAQLLSLDPSYRSAGISGYIYNLLRHLPPVDGRYQFVAFTGERRWCPLPGVEAVQTLWPTSRPVGRILWEQVAQPFSLAKHRVDLFHALAYVSPVVWAGPSVVTILDLSFILFPERFRLLNRIYLKYFTRWSARRASHIIAISNNTKADAIRLLGLDASKVTVVYCGVDAAIRPVDAGALTAFRAAKNLPERFILFLGTLEPRKNIINLIQAYDLLRRDWPGDSSRLPTLVIAGAKGWYYQEIFREIEKSHLTREVQFAGYVPAEELAYWYSAASMFVYPSLYEGFGLPVLEAMACGTPVIASNRSSLPEVVGEAGLLIDPLNPEDIALAMRRLLLEDGLSEVLSTLGKTRSANFTWERTARQTIAVYDHVMGQEA